MSFNRDLYEESTAFKSIKHNPEILSAYQQLTVLSNESSCLSQEYDKLIFNLEHINLKD